MNGETMVVVVMLLTGCGGLEQTRPETDIPSTVEGPFAPRTVPFDGTLTLGSEDLNGSNPRVVRTATGMEPEQIFLALSTPDAMWVSWVTGE